MSRARGQNSRHHHLSELVFVQVTIQLGHSLCSISKKAEQKIKTNYLQVMDELHGKIFQNNDQVNGFLKLQYDAYCDVFLN